jgi:hypothetical protein
MMHDFIFQCQQDFLIDIDTCGLNDFRDQLIILYFN